jgi:pterin-4a-carbinolamine dehydratase
MRTSGDDDPRQASKMKSGKPKALSDAAIRKRLAGELPGWTLSDGAIRRQYPTDDWTSTMMLANAIAYLGETAWHHPDLELGWGRVGVALRTHDAGGVSERDLALAREIERLALWRPEDGSPLPGKPRRRGAPPGD